MCVADVPVMSYVLNWFYTHKIRRVSICANQASQSIRGYFSDGAQLGMALDYYEDAIPRGPAGCILDSAIACRAQTFVVAEGTLIPRISLERMLDVHRQTKASMTVVVEQDHDMSNVNQRFLSPAGVYVFDRQTLRYIRDKGYQDIKECLIPRLCEAGEHVETYVTEEECLRVTDPDSYLRVNEWALNQIGRQSVSVPHYRRWGESMIHTSARIGGAVRLVGPVLIGPRVVVADNVTIVGPTSIGSDCVIGQGATICRSVIWERCRIGQESFADQCIVTSDVELYPESTVCRIAKVGVHRGRGLSVRKLVRSVKLLPNRSESPRADLPVNPAYTIIRQTSGVPVARELATRGTRA